MIQELVNEIFRTGQMKNPFADFDICSAHAASGDKLKAEMFTLRINFNLFSIIYSIIELDDYERKIQQMFVHDLSNHCYAIQMHHESIIKRFRFIMRYSYLLFEKMTSFQVNDPKEIKSLFELTNPLTETEKQYLNAEWWDLMALASEAMNGEGRIKCFVEDSTIKFHVAGDERSWLIDVTPTKYLKIKVPGIIDIANFSICSVPYFSICFLRLIKYLEILSKYCCIRHYSQTFYESYQAKHTGDDAFRILQIEPEENTIALIKILSGIQHASDEYFNIAEFSI